MSQKVVHWRTPAAVEFKGFCSLSALWCITQLRFCVGGGEERGGEERGGEEILGPGSKCDDYHQEVNVAETMVICMAFDTLEQPRKKDKLRAHTP